MLAITSKSPYAVSALVELARTGGSAPVPIGEIASKLWYVPQSLVGPANLICSMWSLAGSDPRVNYPKVKARLGEIGSLYAAVAGMLNLLAMIDSAYKAGSGGES